MLVGRDKECAEIQQLLEHARAGHSASLVLRGDPGVGKSALLRYAKEAATGFTVLSGTGVDVETELAYAGLHQLLHRVLDRLDRLPAPQAAALRSAFALSDEVVHERFKVAVGLLNLLAELAEEAPILCVIDDAQWLDQPSTDALQFVARRLEAEGVVLLIGLRDDGDHPFLGRGLPELVVEPLDEAASRILIAQRLGVTAEPDALGWLLEHAAGNPLALIELPAALTGQQLAGRETVGARIPPPTSVEQVYISRVNDLPPATRTLLLLAAADDSGSRAIIERSADDFGLSIEELAPAETAALLRVDSEWIAFRHPIVRAAVYRAAPFTERERAHRILAAAADREGNPDRAAWHRAAATSGTDEDVARELEQTADRARMRSGHAAAAGALQRAAELTAEPERKAARLVAGASAAWQAGQPERAQRLLDLAAPNVVAPVLRAEFAHLRGMIGWRCGDLPEACSTLISGAQEIADRSAGSALRMLCDAATTSWDSGEFERLREIGVLAANLVGFDEQDDRLLAEVLVTSVALLPGSANVDTAPAISAATEAVTRNDWRLLIWAAIAAELVGDTHLERTLLRRIAGLARTSGAVDQLIVALEAITVQGFLVGDFALAAEATEGARLADEARLPNAANLHRAALAWVAAVRGQRDVCNDHAEATLSLARPNRHGIACAIVEWSLGLLDLGTGRPDPAASRLLALQQAPAGSSHPFYALTSTPDLVEACVRAQRRESALEPLDSLLEYAGDAGPTWAQGLAARCQALVADGDVAEGHYLEALRLHTDAHNAFERARTELVYGEFLRRQRRKADARLHLEAALAVFQPIGADPWSDRARAELRAAGSAIPKRDSGAFDELTPQELQVALLVAEGHSNKVIAAQLFLSARTVEYHLRKVFTKLGLASRTELARHPVVAARPSAAAAS